MDDIDALSSFLSSSEDEGDYVLHCEKAKEYEEKLRAYIFSSYPDIDGATKTFMYLSSRIHDAFKTGTLNIKFEGEKINPVFYATAFYFFSLWLWHECKSSELASRLLE